MFKRLLLPVMIAFLGIPLFSFDGQKPGAKPRKKPAPLTDEEKQILKHREILENLELLQNFEKIQYLDFLADKKTSQNKEQPPVKPAGKDK
jgi:hypothetical protein